MDSSIENIDSEVETFHNGKSNNVVCCVSGCTGRSRKGVSIHQFPKNEILCRKWQQILRIENPISKYYRVCTAHFSQSNYTRDEANKRRRLKYNAMPDQNLPTVKSTLRLRRIPILTNTEEMKKIHGNEPALPTIMTLLTRKSLYDWTGLISTDMLEHLEKRSLLILTGRNSPHSEHTENFPIKYKIVLTLIFFKTKLMNDQLAKLFGISSSSAESIIYEMLPVLREVLSGFVKWPTKQEVEQISFGRFSNVRAIFACTEVKIPKLKCLNCQQMEETLKFVISYTTNCLISYVSSGYCGCTSDKFIFNAENLIEKFESTDSILVHKGFYIERECLNAGVELIRQTFLPGSDKIAKPRSYVELERMMQRINDSEILKNKVDYYLLPYMDDVMVILCALLNVCSPTFSGEFL